MHKILITGATGVVGKAIKNYPEYELIMVSSREANLTDLSETRKLLAVTKPDSIIHLAALSGGRQLSIQRPADMLTQNTLMAHNLITSAKDIGIERIGLALSGACYGKSASRLANEFELHNSPIVEEDYAYAYAKRYLEVMMRAFNSQFGMKIYCFVINGVIGLQMNYSPDKALMVPSLINKVYQAKKNNEIVNVWGDGSPQRQYTWDQDIVRNIFWCHSNQMESTVLNIGTNEIVTVTECAQYICDYFKLDSAKLFFDLSKGNGKSAQLTDNSSFASLTKFEFQKFSMSIEYVCNNFMSQI